MSARTASAAWRSRAASCVAAAASSPSTGAGTTPRRPAPRSNSESSSLRTCDRRSRHVVTTRADRAAPASSGCPSAVMISVMQSTLCPSRRAVRSRLSSVCSISVICPSGAAGGGAAPPSPHWDEEHEHECDRDRERERARSEPCQRQRDGQREDREAVVRAAPRGRRGPVRVERTTRRVHARLLEPEVEARPARLMPAWRLRPICLAFYPIAGQPRGIGVPGRAAGTRAGHEGGAWRILRLLTGYPQLIAALQQFALQPTDFPAPYIVWADGCTAAP